MEVESHRKEVSDKERRLLCGASEYMDLIKQHQKELKEMKQKSDSRKRTLQLFIVLKTIHFIRFAIISKSITVALCSVV